jgi:sporulation protein YlmC with PRC-barrel domain
MLNDQQQEQIMRNNHPLAASLVIVSLVFAALTAQADHEKYIGKKQLGANDIIGKKVMNNQNEDLGKVQDLIVNFDSGNVPYALISSGFGGRSKVAVPLDALQCSADGKSFTLNASKEDFKAAAKTPPERWAIVENAEWVKTVDGYYGQPSRERFERQRSIESGDTRVFTRDPSTVKGAERLIQPADRALCEKVCEAIDNVQVDIDNGVAHLYGTVESEAERQNIEAKVRAVSGVQRVESHLKVKNQ